MIPRTPVCFSHSRLFRNIPYSSVIIRMARLFAAGRTRPQIVRIVNPEKKNMLHLLFTFTEIYYD